MHSHKHAAIKNELVARTEIGIRLAEEQERMTREVKFRRAAEQQALQANEEKSLFFAKMVRGMCGKILSRESVLFLCGLC